MTIASITGIAGQDGPYLVEVLPATSNGVDDSLPGLDAVDSQIEGCE